MKRLYKEYEHFKELYPWKAPEQNELLFTTFDGFDYELKNLLEKQHPDIFAFHHKMSKGHYPPGIEIDVAQQNRYLEAWMSYFRKLALITNNDLGGMEKPSISIGEYMPDIHWYTHYYQAKKKFDWGQKAHDRIMKNISAKAFLDIKKEQIELLMSLSKIDLMAGKGMEILHEVSPEHYQRKMKE